MRQLLTESLVLAAIGGVTGLVLAWWLIDPMTRLVPPQARVPFLDHIGIDSVVLAVTMLLIPVTGVLFGLAPAWQVGRWNLSEVLKEGARGGRGGQRSRRVQRLLVVAQVAISVTLFAAPD